MAKATLQTSGLAAALMVKVRHPKQVPAAARFNDDDAGAAMALRNHVSKSARAITIDNAVLAMGFTLTGYTQAMVRKAFGLRPGATKQNTYLELGSTVKAGGKPERSEQAGHGDLVHTHIEGDRVLCRLTPAGLKVVTKAFGRAPVLSYMVTPVDAPVPATEPVPASEQVTAPPVTVDA